MTKKALNISIYEIETGEIKLDVDATTTGNVVHASVINLLPQAIKQFAEGLAKWNKDQYDQMMKKAVAELIGDDLPKSKVEVSVKDLAPVSKVLAFAVEVAQKFVTKVDDGKARSVETYKDMQDLLEMIKGLATPDQPETK